MIYLDYSATTPVNDEVLNTYVKVTKEFIGNPNSLHKLGVKSKQLIDAATKQIAKILNTKETEIIYTSGASESNNTAIKGICLKYKNRGKHIITTKLEHSSVIEPLNYLKKEGFKIDYVSLNDDGTVNLENLKELMNDDTILVTIASVNSEIGIKQPLEEISKIVKQFPKCYFHSDVTQSIGKEKVDISMLDLASFSSQKFYGVKGIGCLIKKQNIVIEPLIHGGKSTTEYRSGTPATPLIVSMSKALRIATEQIDEKYKYVEYLNNYLKEQLKKLDIYINSNNKCIPHIINISLKNIKSETMLHALENEDIYVSTQTACSNGNYSESVYEVYKDMERSKSSLRISLSYLTTKEELDEFIEIFKIQLQKLNIK